jgi:polysaccharide export outer membrane protein
MKLSPSKRMAYQFAASAAFFLGIIGGVAAQVTTGDYRLHPGDRLFVSVWKETEMQKEVVITPDGKVAFPLAGEFVAAGRSVTEVRAEIETRLKKYIPEPVVTVTVAAVAGNVAYVIGQVQKPGAIVMNPSITVLQALSIAGGTTPYAALNDIIIVRGVAAKQKPYVFRYSDVSRGRSLEQNILLQSGDVIIVP